MTRPHLFENRKFKFVEGKEPLFVYLGLVLAYIVLIGLIIFVYVNLDDQVRLEMKFDSEKSFNSVYMALVESPTKAIRVMNEEGVQGIGIYASNGSAFQLLGDAPATLPLTKLSSAKQKGDDSTLGLYLYDYADKTIEYFRLSRFNVAMETGNLRFGENPLSGSDIPEIVYIKFVSLDFYKNIRNLKFLVIVAVAVISALMALIISIYRNNKFYRTEISKNENLVHLGEAARTLTHEIKNPLSAMTLQSALMRKTLPREYHGDLNVMDQEIQRLISLTDRVSEFLRNPVGNPQKIELVSFISQIAKLFSVSVAIVADSDRPIFIEFDPDRARSVFENLIKNATESASDRNPEVEVCIREKRHMAIVEVKDRGDGISKLDKSKLFNPFFTTKIHGSGIGLSISRSFIKARGGSLKLNERDGGGTVAEVVLPCCEEDKK